MPQVHSAQRQFRFWILAFVVFLLALYVLRDVLLPFVAALILAYLLDPVADRLERMGCSRVVATTLIVGIFFVALIVVALTLVPVLIGQTTAFLTKVPTYVQQLQALAKQYIPSIIERFGGQSEHIEVPPWMGDFAGKAAQWVGTLLQTLLTGGKVILDTFSLLVVTPIVAFYILVDWDRMVARVDSWLPRRQLESIRCIARDIDTAIAGFVRGQSLICLFLATFYGIGLTLTGVNFGLLIGIGAGILSFIPFVGSLGGLIIAMGVGLVQFWPNYLPILGIAAVFGIGQFIEGYILQPKLVGDAVGLHPVWLMFALFAFGSLAGFVGLLLAVPIAAVIGVLSRHFLGVYLGSPYYRDVNAGEDPAA